MEQRKREGYYERAPRLQWLCNRGDQNTFADLVGRKQAEAEAVAFATYFATFLMFNYVVLFVRMGQARCLRHFMIVLMHVIASLVE